MKVTVEIEVEADTGTYDALNAVWLRSPGLPDLDITGYLKVDEYEQVQQSVITELQNRAIRKRDLREMPGEMRGEIQRDELASRAAQRRIGA